MKSSHALHLSDGIHDGHLLDSFFLSQVLSKVSQPCKFLLSVIRLVATIKFFVVAKASYRDHFGSISF